MKRATLALSLLLVAWSLAACGAAGGSNAPALTLGAAPWQDGEQAVYNVLDKNGSSVGTSTFAFKSDGGAWVLSTHDALSSVDQGATIHIDAQTLRPLSIEKTIKAQGTDATVSATYPAGAGRLPIMAVVNGKNKSAAVDVPANLLDNDQLLMTLRAAPLAEGYQASFVNVVVANATKINTTVRVLGSETVTVPAGTFDAWKVELSFGGTQQTAWYEQAAPHRLVQYQNAGSKLVLAKG